MVFCRILQFWIQSCSWLAASQSYREPSLYCYLTNSWAEKKWIHAFPKCICAKWMQHTKLELELSSLFSVSMQIIFMVSHWVQYVCRPVMVDQAFTNVLGETITSETKQKKNILKSYHAAYSLIWSWILDHIYPPEKCYSALTSYHSKCSPE